jgi:Fur family ferric uptake transcriptional regulator
MDKAIEHFVNFLKQKKLRLTIQRKAIVSLFLAREGHLCVDELYYMLRKKYPRIGYTTVYRTLKLLKKAEMASEVNFTGKRKRFEHKFDHPYHGHLVCQKCGKVIEFSDPEIEKKQVRLCRQYGFKSEEHSMKIFGTCPACRKKGR